MQPSITDWILAGSAILIFGSAVLAAIIASKAPKMAARFAEGYRAQNAAREEMQKLKFHTFLQLMAHRADLASPLAQQAVNAVDVLFANYPEVRKARQMFVFAVNERTTDATVIVERYHSLIETVASAMGVASWISPSDIHLGYYPEAAANLDQAALAEAEERIALREAAKQSPDR